MSVKIIQDRLSTYTCKSEIDEMHALREITQELVLAALGRTDFFKVAGFQGGTCLRIFFGLNRFSEDLDFALKEPTPGFEWKMHLQTMMDELSPYGYKIEISDRSNSESAVRKVFIKDDAIGKIMNLHFSGKNGAMRKIRIKLEVDINPPAGGVFEVRYLDFPFVSPVIIQNLSTLFAGKIHALLCREYIKGRDWYDFLWYTSRKTEINFRHLASALKQTGPWRDQDIQPNREWCADSLQKKIESLDWPSVADDVRPFVHVQDMQSLDLWSPKLFLSQLDKIPQ